MTRINKLTIVSALVFFALLLSMMCRANNFSYRETAIEVLTSPRLKEVIDNTNHLLESDSELNKRKSMKELKVEFTPDGGIKIHYLPSMDDATVAPQLRETEPNAFKRMGTYLWEHKKSIILTALSIVGLILGVLL